MNTTKDSSLFSFCARTLALRTPPDQMEVLHTLLPPHIWQMIEKLQEDIILLKRVLTMSYMPPFDKSNAQLDYDPKSLVDNQLKPTFEFPGRCFVVNPTKMELDYEGSALMMEKYLAPSNFFDLCAKLALDEPTERVYASLTEGEQTLLLERHPVVWCRALELSQRPAILHYDDIALSCAEYGLLNALERSLMRVRTLDTSLLQKCILLAIKNGHYHIANKSICDNYSGAFYSIFPDGHVPPRFFSVLLDSDLLRPEVGEQIAADLLDWLSKYDLQRLRRLLDSDPNIKKGILHRFDAMCREISDNKNYPCDYD